MRKPTEIEYQNERAAIDALMSQPKWRELLTILMAQTRAIVEEGRPRARRDTMRLLRVQATVQALGAQIQQRVLKDAPVACKTGCAYWCHKVVEATDLEILFISRMITDSWPREALTKLYQRVSAYATAWHDCPPERRYQLREPCPLLGDDNLCRIYDYRPTVCMGYNSMDVSACKRGFEQNWKAGGTTPIGLEYMFTIQIVKDILTAELANRGIETNQYVFALGMKIALDLGPALAATQWGAGIDIFKEAAWNL